MGVDLVLCKDDGCPFCVKAGQALLDPGLTDPGPVEAKAFHTASVPDIDTLAEEILDISREFGVSAMSAFAAQGIAKHIIKKHMKGEAE